MFKAARLWVITRTLSNIYSLPLFPTPIRYTASPLYSLQVLLLLQATTTNTVWQLLHRSRYLSDNCVCLFEQQRTSGSAESPRDQKHRSAIFVGSDV